MPIDYSVLGDGEEDQSASPVKGGKRDPVSKKQGGRAGGGGGGRAPKHGGFDRQNAGGPSKYEKRQGKGKYNWGGAGEESEVGSLAAADPMAKDEETKGAPEEEEDSNDMTLNEYLAKHEKERPREDKELKVREASDEFEGMKSAAVFVKKSEQDDAPWANSQDSREKKGKKKNKKKATTVSYAEYAGVISGSGERPSRAARSDRGGRGRSRGGARGDGDDFESSSRGDGRRRRGGGRGRSRRRNDGGDDRGEFRGGGRRGGRGRGRGGRGRGRGREDRRGRSNNRGRNRQRGGRNVPILSDEANFPTLGK